MRTTTRRPTLPLTLPITCHGQEIGSYTPLSFATAGVPASTPHLNINTGNPANDEQTLNELMAAARTARWEVHDYTHPTGARTAALEQTLKNRKTALHNSVHHTWAKWAQRRKDRPIPPEATPILVAFRHQTGELSPMLESIIINGRAYGVHIVYAGPLDALPGAAQIMFDLTVSNTNGQLSLTQPPRTIPL